MKLKTSLKSSLFSKTMSLYLVWVSMLITDVLSIPTTPIQGVLTPKIIKCPSCRHKADGSYEIKKEPHHILQCFSDGDLRISACIPCWPSHLVYVKSCDRCVELTSVNSCQPLKTERPIEELTCRVKCSKRGQNYTGFLKDTKKHQFIRCLNGEKILCSRCPFTLELNERWQTCMRQ